LFRKLKLNGFINRQKSEQWFINRFKKTYGEPSKVAIGIGDWEQYKHRKFKEPVKGKGFRDMFRKYGYQIYLVDEHATSCTCHNCQNRTCSTFKDVRNPRPWKDNIIKRHGLLMCKTCKVVWCRDTNSSLNILDIMKSYMADKIRPNHLARQYLSGTTSVST